MLKLILFPVGLISFILGVLLIVYIHMGKNSMTVANEIEGLLLVLIGICGMGFTGIIFAIDERK